ncbi:Secretion protein HlyD [Candidatus Methylopumilus turicensis]|uniref:Secretion protein HlyD n=2 Tax=Candidatus Methylopumilus turicensis TaxID=1581680 RepID=A0A0B7IVW7_9PROT|nr:Secretion protein HlyD [Candidatus Methylopumilus turicensis]
MKAFRMQHKQYYSSRIITTILISTTLIISLALTACGKKESEADAKKKPQAALISTTVAESSVLEIREVSVGTLEGLMDPTLVAEASGRVIKMLAHPGQTVKKGAILALLDPTDYNLERSHAQAEVARLEALTINQGRIVERNQTLVQKKFISQNALDDVTTQHLALQNQLNGAKAQIAIIEHTRAKTTIVAPIDGVVQKQIVSTGEYVKIGDPILQIISKQKLRAHLPLPENMAAKIHAGIKVRLTTPTSSNILVSTIKELKPLISETNRAVDVIADVTDQAGWQPGASVTGEIILGEHSDAVLVHEQCVVLRPAGEVVYVIHQGQALQRIVKTGIRQDGKIEIIEGLVAGEVIAKDGAAFLTDQAKVKIEAKKPSKQ